MCGRCRRLIMGLALLAVGLILALVLPGWLTAAILTGIAGIAVLLWLCR